MNGTDDPRPPTDTNTVLDGRYELLELLGTGGAAEVWRARDRRLGRDVALKLLSGPAARDETHRTRIAREARALAAISHPNVVSIYDYGEQRIEGGDPVPFLVMELVDGPDLSRRLAATGPLDPTEAVEIITAVLRGVQQAHAIGIVHGDLKPANVFLSPDGPKVGDFGVARILAEETGTTAVAATPTYAAPEVLQGNKPEAAADVYSASCIAFELVAGRPPYAGSNFWEVSREHVAAPIPSPRAENASVPEGLDEAIRRGLAKDPTERFLSADAFIAALDPTPPPAAAPEPPAPEAPTVPVPRKTEVLPPTSARGGALLAGIRTRLLAALRKVPPGLAIAALAVLLLVAMKDQATATVRVPDFTGMPMYDAVARAEDAGFEATAVEVDEGGIAGTVVAQRPAPDELSAKGSTIELSVTRGAPQATVPDVSGASVEEARRRIQEAGLSVDELLLVTSAERTGLVLRTEPVAGTSVDEGSAVDVIAALPPQEDRDDDRGNGGPPGEGPGNDGPPEGRGDGNGPGRSDD